MRKNNVLGIILAGGVGSRLYPMSSIGSKHFLPIYDKPMIFYPISVLMLAGIKDFVIVTQKNNIATYKKILKDLILKSPLMPCGPITTPTQVHFSICV